MTKRAKGAKSTQPSDKHDGEEKSGDYEVGYCKPPKHSQFQEGNTLGGGRRKGSKNLRTIINEALQAKVSVTVGGKTKKLTKLELMVQQLVNKASQGDMKAAEKMIQLEERYGTFHNDNAPAPEKLKRDFAAMRNFLSLEEYIDPDYDHEEEEDDE